jgi:hypothetical protein
VHNIILVDGRLIGFHINFKFKHNKGEKIIIAPPQSNYMSWVHECLQFWSLYLVNFVNEKDELMPRVYLLTCLSKKNYSERPSNKMNRCCWFNTHTLVFLSLRRSRGIDERRGELHTFRANEDRMNSPPWLACLDPMCLM